MYSNCLLFVCFFFAVLVFLLSFCLDAVFFIVAVLALFFFVCVVAAVADSELIYSSMHV